MVLYMVLYKLCTRYCIGFVHIIVQTLYRVLYRVLKTGFCFAEGIHYRVFSPWGGETWRLRQIANKFCIASTIITKWYYNMSRPIVWRHELLNATIRYHTR